MSSQEGWTRFGMEFRGRVMAGGTLRAERVQEEQRDDTGKITKGRANGSVRLEPGASAWEGRAARPWAEGSGKEPGKELGSLLRVHRQATLAISSLQQRRLNEVLGASPCSLIPGLELRDLGQNPAFGRPLWNLLLCEQACYQWAL